MKYAKLIILILLISQSLFADEPEAEVEYPEPWFTGTLLSPFAYVIEIGHLNIEPYVYSSSNYGEYNSHWKEHSKPNFYSLTGQFFMWFGIASDWDVEIAPQFSWNHTHGAGHWTLDDLDLALEVQLLREKPHKWYPAMKLAFLATAPIGRYQKLHKNAKGTDSGGFGTWDPGLELAIQKRHHIYDNHFLIMHYSIDYSIPTAVPVKGFNAYGGGTHTRGKVYPGPSLTTIIGAEYNLTKNWALGCDLQYIHSNHTRFAGRKGHTDGVPNTIGYPSGEEFSLAPAIEYNFSANMGIVGGAWFTFAGRNADAFASGIIAITVYK